MEVERRLPQNPTQQSFLSMDDALEKVLHVFSSLKLDDPAGAGYVSQAFAALLNTTAHKGVEMKANGEPTWGHLRHLEGRDDGMNMSLQRIRPWFEARPSRRSRTATTTAECSTSVGEQARVMVSHPSPTPSLLTAEFSGPPAPFVPNGVPRKPKGLLSKLQNAAEKENTRPAPVHVPIVNPCIQSAAQVLAPVVPGPVIRQNLPLSPVPDPIAFGAVPVAPVLTSQIQCAAHSAAPVAPSFANLPELPIPNQVPLPAVAMGQALDNFHPNALCPSPFICPWLFWPM